MTTDSDNIAEIPSVKEQILRILGWVPLVWLFIAPVFLLRAFYFIKAGNSVMQLSDLNQNTLLSIGYTPDPDIAHQLHLYFWLSTIAIFLIAIKVIAETMPNRIKKFILSILTMVILAQAILYFYANQINTFYNHNRGARLTATYSPTYAKQQFNLDCKRRVYAKIDKAGVIQLLCYQSWLDVTPTVKPYHNVPDLFYIWLSKKDMKQLSRINPSVWTLSAWQQKKNHASNHEHEDITQ